MFLPKSKSKVSGTIASLTKGTDAEMLNQHIECNSV